MERFFIVSYSYGNGFGQCGIFTKKSQYVNREYVCKYVNEKTPGLGKIIIINIIEVSEKEYFQFIEPIED